MTRPNQPNTFTTLRSLHRDRPNPKYWITPPDILLKLDKEFDFDCDPCPFPLPYPGYNSLHLPWGQSNYVNPPYRRDDGVDGRGRSAFAYKAIDEHKHGKQSVLILPVPACVNALLEVGAEVRSMGRVRWLSAITGEPWKSPIATALFVLRR
jgi:hypothetical protein